MQATVLFIPGLLCDARLWRDQIDALGDTIRAVVADVTRDDSIEAMARRALADMPDRFSVCGLSMGGYVAFEIMRLAGTRVDRLCLMDTSARDDTAEQAKARRDFISLARRGRFRGVTPRLLPRLIHPAHVNDAQLAAEIIAMADRVGRDAFVRQETAILSRPDSRPFLAHISAPTLVVSGSDDMLIPLPVVREIAELTPGARFLVVGGAGHLPPMERPDAVTAVLRDWLGPAILGSKIEA
jgi:pimeloyl-ACP methyl ester carboxylesterase